MPWNSTWPDGTVSVKANDATGVQNTNYIKATMGASIVGTNTGATTDHFWDVDANLNGHHRFVKMPKFTSTAVAPDDTDPAIGVGIDAAYYAKLKLTLESTAAQDVQAFFKNTTSPVMQLLGIRAMGVFTGGAADPTQAEVLYSHNLATQTAGTKGIVHTSTGHYTVTFATALPTANYLILGGAIRDSDAELLFGVRGNASLAAVKSTTMFKFSTQSDGGTVHNPLQAWFICFGG